MASTQRARPNWYTKDDDSTWERVKAAFHRDWKQTKHDFGGDEPDLDQQVGDTVSQAAGSKPIPPGNVPTPHPDSDPDVYRDTDEPAYKYGYTAYRHFGSQCEWCDDTEARLQKDWNDDADWERRRTAVRRGWNYAKMNKDSAADI